MDLFRTPLISVTCVNSVLALSAAIGNGLVIAAILRSPNLQTPSFILITSLAFTDLLVGLFSCLIIVNTSYIVFNAKVNDFWLAIMFTEILTILPNFTSIFVSLLISVDRYLAVSHRQRYRQIVTKKKIILSVATACGLSIIVVLAFTYHEKINNFFYRALIGLLCVIIICFFYVSSFEVFIDILHKCNQVKMANRQHLMPQNTEKHLKQCW